ncbi:non-ribosomal peptide synthetase [Streptomyces sp. NBC_00059]|uniref:non-ribosomal peptide synthetase n=1 Tax=Streptomyces sp. NBC_00059 TaxID=2975635 RepID=UPI0022595EFF|nr:non-ribosomal peptide synthetase [Streptomyces sp. NBC_00059]MCX5414497.1 amino acid adenylation domain-containing protein [Streptomyces sp. NBC_00059]
MSDLLGRLASLPAPERARLMARLRQGGTGPDAGSPAVAAGPDAAAAGPDAGSAGTPVEAAGPAGPAATDAQRRLWLLQRLDPASPAHHLSAAFRLAGPLDTGALGAALTEITARHPALRTGFREHDGRPVPHVVEPAAALPRTVDLGALPPKDREPRAHALHQEHGTRPFDLERPPLVRFTLYRCADDHHVLTVVAHHLVCDGWSVAVFAEELAALYGAFVEGRPSPLPPPPAAPTEERRPEGAEYARSAAYWRAALDGDPPALDLPADRPRPVRETVRGARHGLRLPAALLDEVRAAAGRDRSTVYAFLLAAYAVTLYRVTGGRDLVIGAPVDERRGAAEERLIGFHVNTLPLRVRLRPDQTHAAAARHAGEVLSGALAHDLPFGDIVREVNPPRPPGRPVLRQTAFSLQPAVAGVLGAGGITLTPVAPDAFHLGVSPLELALHLREQDGELLGCLEYRTDLFDAVTVAGWAEEFQETVRRAVRSPRALLAPPAREPAPTPAATTATPSAPDTNLTDSQLALYFGKKTSGDVRLYYENVTALLTLTGTLDHPRFQRAFQKLVDHSDSLRSTFHEVEGVPVRRVSETVPAPVDLVDLSGAADPRAAALAWARRRTATGLAPSRAVFDSALLRLGPDAWAWYLDVDHLVCDAWSMALILRTLSDYYELDREGRLGEAPPLPPFQAYADHERAGRGSERRRRARRHWEALAAQPVERLAFHGREEDLAGQTRTARISLDLGPRRSARITGFARAEGYASPATAFGAALFAYLHRVGGGELLRIGTPFAGRPAEFRSTIGLFMNVLPLQVRIDGDTTLRMLAREVQRAFLDAARRQDHVPRHRGGTRLYDVYLNYQNAVFEGFGSPAGFDLVDTGHSPDRLTLQVRELRPDAGAEPRFVLDFDFHTACFDEAERERATGHYLALLDALTTSPEAPVSAPAMLSEAELAVLDAFNDTARPYDLSAPLHARVEQQARRTPDAPAVVFEGSTLTYAALDADADRLARRIRQAVRLSGGGRFEPGTAVAVHLGRSAHLVVALLAVLKAGGAYLPVDPATPAERMAFMLSDAGAALVLTSGPLPHGGLPDGIPVLQVDEAGAAGADTPGGAGETADPAAPADPDLPAYLIYTSGSTGVPKCVEVTHRAICNRLLWMQETYGLTAADTVLQKTPFTFDVSVWEFFWPLMTGARLVVARPEGHRDPEYLAGLIRREAVTTVHFVPSMLRVHLDDPATAGGGSLRRVFASGEALPPDLVRAFLLRYPHPEVELHNLYGPTEAAVDVSAWRCAPEDADGPVPIGRPVANTTLDVLDGRLCPVPLGIVGELHIGGVQLAAGYRNREELTAERFVPDPRRPGGRLYRTGDLVRQRTDGALEFLGRADGQVKLRGFRIELGEIETRLAAHPGVRAAAVRTWQDRLVAYVVPAAGADAAPGRDELRTFLARSLPDHMVPGVYAALDALPVTVNGKLDRAALPEPVPHPASTVPGTAASARTPVQRAVAELWGELLGRDPDTIGPDEDFFELGGHSLLAARLVAAVGRRFGVRLPLTSLFEAPTVALFAALLSAGSAHAQVLPLRAPVTPAPLFLFHPAGGDVMAYRELVNLLPGGREVLGIRSRALSGEPEAESFAAMAAQYAELVRGHRPSGPYHLAGWSMGGALAVEVAALLEAAGEEVALVALLDSSVPGAGRPDPLLAPAVALADILPDLAVTPQEAAGLRERLRGLPLQERLKLLVARAEERGRPAAPTEALLHQAELAEHHEQVVLGHRPTAVDAPLTVWWARDRLREPRTDWAPLTRGGIREEATLPGDHFTLLRPPYVTEVAKRLAAALDAGPAPVPVPPGRDAPPPVPHEPSTGIEQEREGSEQL